MKLINKTALIYGVSTFLIVLISGGINYYLLDARIENRVDKRLYLEKETIQKKINSNPNINISTYESERIQIDKLPKHTINSDSLYTFLIQDEIDSELYEVRILQSSIDIGEKTYSIQIKRNLEGTTLFAVSIFYVFLISFALIFIILIAIQVFFFRKMWEPFHETLSTLKQSNLRKDVIVFPLTKTQEFNELNTELNNFASRAHETFISQRHYSENLSHELLTPLAIIRTKAELLLQAPNLSEKDLLNLDSIIQTVGRLSKVNQALILLSKIDNNQFVDKEEINLKELLNASLENFEDQVRLKHLQVRLMLNPDFTLVSNLTLLSILVSNLIKNSIFHNINKGDVQITLQNNLLTITNTGIVSSKPNDDFFQRFVSEKSSENSIGIGLSIVKRICTLFNYTICYQTTDNEHKVTVLF